MYGRIASNVQPSTAESGQREDAQPLLSADITLSRFGGDETLVSEIAAVFVRTVPQLMATVTAAVDAGELERAFHQAHSLKGAVAAFEAPEVLRAVLEVEGHAKNADAAATASAWPAARALVERLIRELALLVPAGTTMPASGANGSR
ncbi:MAG TPA: Hpt domain-containing protein [Burkholderiales bacterium]|jgi:HPt (histidine-containing phosphotransfer) domain-containing protein|nr:Hpt domain-containing protein [Burkholderiales bacterium]